MPPAGGAQSGISPVDPQRTADVPRQASGARGKSDNCGESVRAGQRGGRPWPALSSRPRKDEGSPALPTAVMLSLGCCRNRAGSVPPGLAAGMGQWLPVSPPQPPAVLARLRGTAYKACPSVSVFSPFVPWWREGVCGHSCVPTPTLAPADRRAGEQSGKGPGCRSPLGAAGDAEASGPTALHMACRGPSTPTYLWPGSPAGPGEGRGGPAHPPGKPC